MRFHMPVTLVLCLAVFGSATVAGCAPANAVPEIVSLSPHKDVVAPLDSCLLECIVEDADSDDLQYSWSADSGTINGYEGTVAWTAPAKEGIYHITCEVTDGVEHANGVSSARQTVTIVVKDNHFPFIDGMGADCDWIRPGGQCAVHCVASDVDGDALSYAWSTDAGTVSGEGPDAVWTAPDVEGDFIVRVLVNDGYGGERSASTVIRTAVDEPLVVTDMVVTMLDEPQYLKFYNERFKILKGRTCLIRCEVNEPLRIVSYEWTDGGPVCVFPVGGERFVFESGANEIRWTAPREEGTFEINVVARDASGHYAEKTITINVATCTCAFSEESSEGETPEQSAAAAAEQH